MPVPALQSAKRRQAAGVCVFLFLVGVLTSLAFHRLRGDAVAYRRGERAYARGDYVAAVDFYEKARSAGLVLSALERRLADALVQTERPADAFAVLGELLEREPGDRGARVAAIGLAQRLGDPELGLGLMAGIGPEDALGTEDLVRLADLYQQAGRLAEAVRVLRRLAIVQPRWADLHIYLGNLYARLGDRAAARAAFEAAVRADPVGRAARLALARVLAWEGNYVASAAHYRAYLGDAPPP